MFKSRPHFETGPVRPGLKPFLSIFDIFDQPSDYFKPHWGHFSKKNSTGNFQKMKKSGTKIIKDSFFNFEISDFSIK
jgi:hypothetical protein